MGYSLTNFPDVFCTGKRYTMKKVLMENLSKFFETKFWFYFGPFWLYWFKLKLCRESGLLKCLCYSTFIQKNQKKTNEANLMSLKLTTDKTLHNIR